jgi:hypothetical protein
VELIHDLYDSSRENKIFLHTRFDCGDDVLAPYKKKLKRFLNPDDFRSDQDVSVSQARRTLSDYKRATGKPVEFLELMVFYCEQASAFSQNFGMEGRSWFSSLLRVFRDALKVASTIPTKQRSTYISRLDRVRLACQSFGRFVGDDMNIIWGAVSRCFVA